MKRDKLWIGSIFVFVCLICWGLTTMRSVAIIDSSIDSTTIGGSVPSSGQFTWTSANSSNPGITVGGSYNEWNLSGGGGEFDLISLKSNGGGGFSFYNGTNGSNLSLIAHMDGSGNFTAPSFAGNLLGNASSATQLAATPSQCPGQAYSTGIQANGSANCTALPKTQGVNASGCTTGGNSYDTCGPIAMTFPSAFNSITGYSCSLLDSNTGNTGDALTVVVSALSNTSISVLVQTQRANPGTASQVSCTVTGT